MTASRLASIYAEKMLLLIASDHRHHEREREKLEREGREMCGAGWRARFSRIGLGSCLRELCIFMSREGLDLFFSFLFGVWMAYIPVAPDSFAATSCPRSRVLYNIKKDNSIANPRNKKLSDLD